MGLKFCSKCKSILKYVQEEDKMYLFCGRCEHKEPVKSEYVGSEYTTEEKVTVISEAEQKLRAMETSKSECPKCKHDTAFIWMVLLRGGDEAATQFFKCVKCGNTRRLYP